MASKTKARKPTQSQRFIDAAREAECSEDEAVFDETLKRIAKAKPTTSSKPDFPSATDLSFLIGDRIGQVRLDPWSLQFIFTSKSGISVRGRIEHVDEAGNIHLHDCRRRKRNAIYLHQLIECPITGVNVKPDCLSIQFEGGAILRMFSDDAHECGVIYPFQRPFFVF